MSPLTLQTHELQEENTRVRVTHLRIHRHTHALPEAVATGAITDPSSRRNDPYDEHGKIS